MIALSQGILKFFRRQHTSSFRPLIYLFYLFDVRKGEVGESDDKLSGRQDCDYEIC